MTTVSHDWDSNPGVLQTDKFSWLTRMDINLEIQCAKKMTHYVHRLFTVEDPQHDFPMLVLFPVCSFNMY